MALLSSSSCSSSIAEPEYEMPHVLAVDESSVDRKLIEWLLASSSCKVTTAKNGQRALEFLGLGEGHHAMTKTSIKIKNEYSSEREKEHVETSINFDPLYQLCSTEIFKVYNFSLIKKIKESESRSYGVIVNSVYKLEPEYALLSSLTQKLKRKPYRKKEQNYHPYLAKNDTRS
nr:hypothetical protein TEA_016136 [Ipomoea trifida]GMD60410.1 two-component response regulator ARR17-like [Ipomoea batatas]